MKSQDQTVTQKTEIPQYIEDFTRNTLDRAGTISDQPYVPYTGDRLAGFTPAQLQAWANTQAQQGQGFAGCGCGQHRRLFRWGHRGIPRNARNRSGLVGDGQ